VGEVVIRGPTVMRGYWEMPELTAATVKQGWFHSGDLAYRDEEGYIFLTDRKKDMIITGGFNVYPKEVEEVLYTHPSVFECAVIGVPDADWGEAVRAIVAPRPGARVTEEELLGFCREHLSAFKRPKSVGFVEEIPRNPSGKVLKRVLREQEARNQPQRKEKKWRDHP
jgi:acyl-CoA synthetase (AMP-forming)/AMP-acid ligase II